VEAEGVPESSPAEPEYVFWLAGFFFFWQAEG
jgi:hypothetical protein